MRAWIEYSHGRDAAAWSEQHARGEVPDRLPYGLDRLADSGIVPVARPRLPPGPLRTVARVARRGGYQWVEAATARPGPDVDVCVCWDERSGAPRAAVDGDKVSVASGAIWITDHPAHPLHLAAARALRRATVVWVHSQPQMDVLVRMGLPRQRLAFVHFGVDADFFHRSHDDGREPGLIVSAGNDRDRDWPTLLAAFAEVRRRLPGARLEVATQARLPQLPGLTVHPRLTHLQLRELYARAWCVAVPTRLNLHLSGLTNLLEAMAMAVPAVMSTTPGVDDYVSDGQTGVLVRPGDPLDVARGLLAVLDLDEAGARRLGAAARAEVDVRGSTAQHARALAALLRSHG